MKETLVCSLCQKNWKREISRGRKPVVCPKCSAKNASKTIKKEVQPKNNNHEPEIVKETLDLEPISISQVFRDYYPKPNNYEELIESTKKGSLWHCSKCNKELKCSIALSAIPVHTCPPNTGKIREYERVS